MPTFCAAYGCSNAGYKDNVVSFHSFPLNDPHLLRIWKIKIRRKDFFPNKYSRLCSDHFEDDCFIGQNIRGRKLKPNSIPTKFTYKSKKEQRIESANELLRTLNPDDIPTKMNDESTDEIIQLSDDSTEFQSAEVETILTEDEMDTAEVSPKKSIKDNGHSPKQSKNDPSSQILKRAKRISVLKNILMSTVIKRSLKRTLLESEIKAANARTDFYEKKKSLLSLRSDLSDSKSVTLSMAEQKILGVLKDEELAFKIEKELLQKQLVEAEEKASSSIKTYYEMKKSAGKKEGFLFLKDLL